jgi:hypothetical protein
MAEKKIPNRPPNISPTKRDEVLYQKISGANFNKQIVEDHFLQSLKEFHWLYKKIAK